MGSVLFDFLTESVLFSQEHLENQYQSLLDDEIVTELHRYREFCLSHKSELLAEAIGSKSTFKIFPGLHPVDPRLLKQGALYVERYVLSDPLFSLTEPEKSFDRAMRSYLGGAETHGVDREAVAHAVRQLKNLTPMVAADYVKCLPVSYLFERGESLPLYYSKDRFSEALSVDLRSYFHEHKQIWPLRRDGTAWVRDSDLRTSRCIAIEFGDDDQGGMLYQLFEQEIEKLDETTGMFTVSMTLPDSPPSPPYYDVWVEQSVNRTAINFSDRLSTELALSVQLGASYICFSKFRNQFLTRFLPAKVGTSEYTANVFLNVEVPFLDEIDTETLMRVRRDEGGAFQAFRHELEQRLLDLKAEEDPARLRAKAEQVIRDIGTVQPELLTQKLYRLRRGAIADAVILCSTMVGTFISTNHLAGAASATGAAAAAYKLFNYSGELRDNPTFFLWKARRSSQGKNR